MPAESQMQTNPKHPAQRPDITPHQSREEEKGIGFREIVSRPKQKSNPCLWVKSTRNMRNSLPPK